MANAALTLAMVLLACLLLPPSLGGATTSTIVSGQSMEPLYSTGDLVIARSGEPEVGDVVVYEAPMEEGTYRVIHRIVGGNGADGWVVQGDNNDFLDPWEPTADEITGIAQVHLPRVGALLHGLSNPLIWGGLILLAGAVLVGARSEDDDTSAAAAGTEAAGATTLARAAEEPT